MNASIVEAPPDPDRSTPAGPPLHSTPTIRARIRPVPVPGPDVASSGGPSFSLARCVVAPAPLARTVDEFDGRLGHWDGLRGHDHWSAAPERVTVHLGDRTLTLPTTAMGALRMLSDGRPVRVGDLPGLDEPSRVVLAKRLVREAACIIDALG